MTQERNDIDFKVITNFWVKEIDEMIKIKMNYIWSLKKQTVDCEDEAALEVTQMTEVLRKFKLGL